MVMTAIANYRSTMVNELGRLVAERLQQLGRTQAWLARQMRTSPGHVSRIVKGQTKPSKATMDKLAEALGLDQGTVQRAYMVSRDMGDAFVDEQPDLEDPNLRDVVAMWGELTPAQQQAQLATMRAAIDALRQARRPKRRRD